MKQLGLVHHPEQQQLLNRSIFNKKKRGRPSKQELADRVATLASSDTAALATALLAPVSPSVIPEMVTTAAKKRKPQVTTTTARKSKRLNIESTE